MSVEQKQENQHADPLQPPIGPVSLAFLQIKKLLQLFILPILITFFILFGIWVLLSGRFDLFHITLGVISCMIIALYSCDLLFARPIHRTMPLIWFRFCRYIPWLLYQIFLANIHVMRLVFHPKMKDLIDPKIITFDSRLKSDMSLVIFANSITLTPGTITVYVTVYGRFSVHIIDQASGQSLPGEMEERIGKILGE
jgi:multicomponent Na+:H+ antiporter subunit E